MTIKTSSYRQSLLTALLDPIEASAYLNAALEDSPEAFLKALKNVAQARPMAQVAKQAGIQREPFTAPSLSRGIRPLRLFPQFSAHWE